MFGDYFGQRGDYSTGLNYSCHYTYLNDGNKNGLEAPNEFKSRRALRNIKMMGQQQKKAARKISFHVHFPPTHCKDKFKNAANMVMNAKLFEQAAKDLFTKKKSEHDSKEEDVWVPKNEAGVKFWVNAATREIRTEPELEKLTKISGPRSRKGVRSSITVKEGAILPKRRSSSMFYKNLEEGTGSLVYDDQEMKEFWELLDHQN